MSISFEFTAKLQKGDEFLHVLEQLALQSDLMYCSGENWAQVDFCYMGSMHFSFAGLSWNGVVGA